MKMDLADEGRTFSKTSFRCMLTMNAASIKNAAATCAHGLMSYYKNNQSTTAAADVGTFPKPIYWWESGAVWGGMVDYFTYTGDKSYLKATSDALMAQIGPDADFIVPAHRGDEGNDDQAFWALSVMSAVEHGFPQPANKPAWADIAANTFNNMITRWMTDVCGGGFKWQIYPENRLGTCFYQPI
jgi:mannan endo-1,6-alpha-mannosidase